MKKYLSVFCTLSVVLLLIAGCKKSDTTPAPVYTVPTTYNFSNANFADATTRLGMATEVGNLTKLATSGPIDGPRIKAMLTNTGAPFVTAAYNTSGLQMLDQFAPAFKTDIISFIDSLVKVAATGTVASRGVAGVGTSNASATTKYALTGLGVNYAQFINKGFMGGFVTYQEVTIMSSISTYDNTAVVNGSTAMEHAWDMAFGYWGVPIDFPTNKTGAKFWGSYTTQVDSGYKANKALMSAFLKGRAAISAKDMPTVTAQAAIILDVFDKLNAAGALQEVQETKAAITDPISRNSRMSEMKGFIYSIKYNPKRSLSDTQYNALLALFPANFYDLTSTQLDALRDAVASPYGFDAVKNIL
ncbi:MAG: hypothetical protein JWQ79_1044 [Mucilaginibacter sp.]|jgi:hypothetical protein|nr:hypothetical protein [Mucilaginibacter sp.]